MSDLMRSWLVGAISLTLLNVACGKAASQSGDEENTRKPLDGGDPVEPAAEDTSDDDTAPDDTADEPSDDSSEPSDDTMSDDDDIPDDDVDDDTAPSDDEPAPDDDSSGDDDSADDEPAPSDDDDTADDDTADDDDDDVLRFDPTYRGGLCSDGWCWSTPLLHGSAVYEMWSSQAHGVWVSTRGGGVLHHDDAGWQRVALPDVARGSIDVWGTAEGALVADGNALWLLNGTSKTALPTPELEQSLWDLGGTSLADLWIGTDGLVHFDGTSWQQIAAYSSALVVYSVVSSRPNEVWTIKDTHRELGYWDGTDYTVVVPEDVASVHVITPDEVWYRIDYQHYRGNFEQGFEVVDEYLPTRDLFGLAEDDLFALGDLELEHFDGEDWTPVSANFDGNVMYKGTSVLPGQAWVGGQRGQIFHFDGEWQATVPPVPQRLRQSFTNIWSDGAQVYAVGYGLFSLDRSGEVDVWNEVVQDGLSWFPQAIWGSSPTDIWIVGIGDQIYRFDGMEVEALELDDTNPNASWTAIHGASATDIWAVGEDGLARHFDGTDWTLTNTASVSNLDDVWVAPDGNAWAVGNNGVAMRYTPGGTWEDIDELTISSIQYTAVSGTSSSDVWIAGYGDQIYHFDGIEWTEVDAPQTGRINKLWALANDDVWAAGNGGLLMHFDGVSWSFVNAKIDDSLAGLWVGPDGEAWAAGAFGVILHRP